MRKANARPGRHRLGAVLAVVATMLTVLEARSQNPVTISYVGLDTTHLVCVYSTDIATKIELRFSKDGGPHQLLDTYGASVSATFHHASLSSGNYAYVLYVYTNATEYFGVSGWSSDVGNAAYGTLLFDDTMDGPAAGKSVVLLCDIFVPSGTELTMNPGMYSTYVSGSIYVSGTLHRSSMASSLGIQIELYSTFTASGQSNAHFVFMPGSESSSLTCGSNLHIYVHKRMTATDIHDVFLELEPGSDGSSIVGGNDMVVYCHGGGEFTGSSNLLISVYGDASNVTLNGCEAAFDYTGEFAPNGYLRLQSCQVSNSMLHSFSRVDAVQTTFNQPVEIGVSNQVTAALLDRCVFNSACGVVGMDGSTATLDDCWFRGGLGVAGGSPAFTRCESGGMTYLGGRTGAKFYNCVFQDAVVVSGDSWLTDTTPVPDFMNNSFMGRVAFTNGLSSSPATPINVGYNYYGDPAGPNPNESRTAFLANRGAIIVGTGTVFEVDAWATEANPAAVAHDTNSFPSFWLSGMIMGQTTLDHTMNCQVAGPLVRGRETLVCVDIATSAREVYGARIYVEDTLGHRYYATNSTYRGGLVLRRDHSSLGAHQRSAWNTANIILPPVDTNIHVTYSLILDTTGVPGYATTGTVTLPYLYRTTVQYAPAPPRSFRLMVSPVRVIALGYPSAPPDGIVAKPTMRDLMAGMLPIGTNHMTVRGPNTYVSYVSLAGTFSFNAFLLGLSAHLRAAMALINACGAVDGMGDQIDMVAVPLRNGVFPAGSEGACFAWPGLRSVVFYDETFPEAVLHEMGHTVGLYTGIEQYDLYPPDGLQVTGVTAFVADPGLGYCSRGIEFKRIEHYPLPGVAWWQAGAPFDIMGGMSSGCWTLPSTYQPFLEYFNALYRRKDASASPTAAGAARLLPGDRRIYVTAQVESYTNGAGSLSARLVPESIRAMNLTAFASNSVQLTDALIGDSYTLQPYNSSGMALAPQLFQIHFDTNSAVFGLWWQTFDLIPMVARYEIRHSPDNQVVFSVGGGGTISNQIVWPLPGAMLTNNLIPLAWTAQGGKNGGATHSQPLQHLVLMRGDPQQPWLPCSMFTEQTSFELATDMICSTGTLELCVASSDGLDAGIASVGGLSAPERPLLATIDLPRNGDSGTTNTLWTFSASASSPDDGMLTSGIWHSSVDGTLGSGMTIPARTLSLGPHDISFSATESRGIAATAHVAIVVSASGSIDLSLATNSLSLHVPGWAATDPASVRLVTGFLHAATLALRTPGVTSSFAMLLYLAPPSGVPALVASNNVSDMPPFSELSITAGVVPWEKGTYSFIGVVTNAMPGDSNPANDTRVWTVSSLMPPRLVAQPDSMSFGSVAVGTPVFASLSITNAGDETLHLGTLAVTGAQAGAFLITNDACSGAALAAGQHSTAQLRFIAGAETGYTAHLMFTCDDPTTPLCVMDLSGTGVPEPAAAAGIVVGYWLVAIRRRHQGSSRATDRRLARHDRA